MSKHGKQDDKDKYTRNGHEPDRPLPSEDPGGEHAKDEEEEDEET